MTTSTSHDAAQAGEPRDGHFLAIEEWSGRKPKRLSVPGMKSGRQRIVVEFEDGEQVSVSSTSMDRAWDVLRRRLTVRLLAGGGSAHAE